MPPRYRGYVLTVLTVFAVLLAGAPAHALTVSGLRFGIHPDKVRMVLDMNEAPDFRVFTLSNPWRLAIDLPAFDWRAGVIQAPPQSGVKSIRQGALQPGVSRIVMDIGGPIDVRAAFVLPREGGKPDRLVIDFAKGTPEIFAAQKDLILGKLPVSGDVGMGAERLSAASLAQVASVRPPPSAPEAPPPRPVEQAAALAMPGMVVPQKKPEQVEADSVLSDKARQTPPPAAAVAGRGRKPVIIIDPGHGGVDPGAVGSGDLFEKHVTLSMAVELQRQLESTGRYNVKLTRENDKYLRLYQRVDFARRNKGDLFISLHADSIGKAAVRGASIYTLSEKASDEQTERLAMQENRADLIAGVDLSAEDESVVGILVDLAMRDTMNQSKFFANTVVDSFQAQRIRLLENPHRYAGFAVLKAADIPSILIEMGFMSNKTEAAVLASPDFQKTLAGALVASIDGYFDKVGVE